MERIQPHGVFVVGILTTLSALVMFYLTFFGYVFSPNRWIIVVLFGGFGVLLLLDAVLIFRGVRAGWYLAIVLWVMLLFGLCVTYYSLFLPVVTGSATFGDVNLQTIIGIIALIMCPVLYPAIGLIYFLRKNVRRYFGT